MVRHGTVVSTKWLPTRLWSGNLPSFHLLNQEETELEKQISKIYFASYRFADLRMQIRLKLKELPIQSQLPRSDYPAVYWEILELLDEYLPLLLSIQRYHSARHPMSKTLPHLLTTFSPLFYGFGDLDLLTDRVVGKQNRSQFSIPVELQLVLCTMGHLYAMHADSQIMQGGETLTVVNWPSMQHAELSWQSAEGFYRWAASHSNQIQEKLDSSDSVTIPMWKFFDAMGTYTTILSRLCSTHRLSTHISGLSLTEMRPEQLTRIGSGCARRALTLVKEANALQSELPDSSFSRQIKWCISAYEIRWMAIYYHCESTIYRLDANPEIAIYFCEHVLKLRIPHLSLLSPLQQDSGFSQFAHEIQLKHHAHQNEALDDKKTLLDSGRRRFGAFQVVGKCLTAQLLTIRELGPVFSDEKRFIDCGIGEEESNYASPFLVEVITANVEEEILHVQMEYPESHLSNESETNITKDSQQRPTKFSNKGLTECRTVTTPQNGNPESQTKFNFVKQKQEAHSSAKTPSLGQQQKRPLSATPQSSGWVTMSYGGKLLHFEKSADSPLETSFQCKDDSIQNENLDDSHRSAIRRSKPRPSSSPCYLSSRKTSQRHDQIAMKDNTKMWAPTRALCALCEQRFMRSSLPGVVIMKRVYDLRRKWGVIQDSKKFHAPSLLYGTANVCLLCQEILAYEDTKQLLKPANGKTLSEQQSESLSLDSKIFVDSKFDKDANIGRMIHDSIMHRWHQQPPNRNNDSNLEDIAVNKRVRQSSTVFSMKAQNALDPDITRSAHTKEEFQPWWEIDLGNFVEVHSVKVYLRDEVSHLYSGGRGVAAIPGRHTPGVYPLHISISMKSGVGRDCGDNIASSVSSLCIMDKMAPLIEWVAPCKSRGRFVRIQCEGRAILHIERVQVYVAKPTLKVDPVVRRQHFRQKLQRAALCASALATTATPLTGSSHVAVTAESTITRTGTHRGSQVSLEEPPSAMFFDSDRAEKKRISRLYIRFKSLLDARAKYYTPENHIDDGENTT